MERRAKTISIEITQKTSIEEMWMRSKNKSAFDYLDCQGWLDIIGFLKNIFKTF